MPIYYLVIIDFYQSFALKPLRDFLYIVVTPSECLEYSFYINSRVELVSDREVCGQLVRVTLTNENVKEYIVTM